jgi:hypothetical protein
MFAPKREEVAGGSRRLRNEELCNLYFSPNIIKVTKSRSMRWAGHVAHMGEMRNAYTVLARNHEGRNRVDSYRLDLSGSE